MRLLLVGSFLALLALPLFANEQEEEEQKTIMVIKALVLPKSFTELEKNQSNKIVLKAVAKNRNYQMMIGDYDQSLKVKYPIQIIEVKVAEPKSREFNLLIRLFDEKSKKLLNKVQVQDISKISFFRELESGMEKIFIIPEPEIKPSVNTSNPQ